MTREEITGTVKREMDFRVVQPSYGVIAYVHYSFLFAIWNSKYKVRPKSFNQKKREGILFLVLSSPFYSEGKGVSSKKWSDILSLKIRD